MKFARAHLVVSGLVLAPLLVSCTDSSSTVDEETLTYSRIAEVVRCADHPRYSSPSRAELVELDIDAGLACRWRGPRAEDKPPQLIREVSLTPKELATLQTQLGKAVAGITDCGDYTALPHVTYTLYLSDTSGETWQIEVPDDFCLGFQMGGEPYISSKVTQTLRLVTGTG